MIPFLRTKLAWHLLPFLEQGITILSSCQAVSVDLEEKFLKVKRVIASGDGQLVFGDTIKVRLFSKALVAVTHYGVCQTWIYRQSMRENRKVHPSDQTIVCIAYPSFRYSMRWM